MLPLGTLPPGDPSGGVVYLRIFLSPEQASHLWTFLNISVLQGRIFSTSPNPQAGGPPLVGCPRLLIQFIRSYPPYRRPFLYPQPEDAPYRGDREPLHGPYSTTLHLYLTLSQYGIKFLIYEFLVYLILSCTLSPYSYLITFLFKVLFPRF